MNQQFEITLITSKTYADFVMQKSFIDWSTELDMGWYQFIEHFLLKERCPPKLTHAFDTNWHLSKYAEHQTQYLREILHFQRQMFVKH